MELYSNRVLQELLSSGITPHTLSFCLNKDGCNYFYLKLGFKRNQSYFALFSSPQEINETTLNSLANFSNRQLQIVQKYNDFIKAQELIHIDDVTGLFNQRKLYKDLKVLIDKFEHDQIPFCVLFIDIDHFKRVNDSYGHLIGTKLLEDVASDIKKLLRDGDITYRYGGDEFVIILVDAVAASGKIVGERILEKIKSRTYEFTQKSEVQNLRLSVSIGVAEFPGDARNSDEVLALADRMMYEAKESGRGLVFNTNDIFKASLQKAVKGQ
jgi:diguanylate cyclase (GGDEF)-like protein